MNRIHKLIELVKSYYQSPDPAHDWAHIGRVAATAKSLCQGSKAHEECVLAAVYCHDLINLPKNHPERREASTLSAREALPHLEKAGFTPDEITIIQTAIIEHSYSKGLRPSTLEAAILQDADRIDALGAIGILRCAAVNAQMKSRFYDPFDPLAEMRDYDDKSFMLDHYSEKLFKLPDLMNTEGAKVLANKRVAYMRAFIQELMSEIRG